MERFQWFFDVLGNQFKNVEHALKKLFAYIPYIGQTASDHSNLIMLTFMIVLTVFIIRPLVKWSLGIVIMGAVLAAMVSNKNKINIF